jgi:hypothetical protein
METRSSSRVPRSSPNVLFTGRSPPRAIVGVPVDLDSGQRPFGNPETLFRPRIRRDMFTPHPDGQRFVVIERLDPEIHRAIPAQLVVEWRLAPCWSRRSHGQSR